MLKEKVDTEFCGLSDEEKKLIEEKEEDIVIDGEVMKIFSPKDNSEKTACGQLIYLQKRC